MTPNPRRKRRKEKNTKRRRGEFEERNKNFIKMAKTVSKQKPRGHFLATSPTRTQNVTHPLVPNYHKLVSSPGKNLKNAIFKTTSVLQPQGFFCPRNPTWSKNRTSEKKQFVRPTEIILKKLCKIKPAQHVERESKRRNDAKSLRNPLFLSVSRLSPSSASPP